MTKQLKSVILGLTMTVGAAVHSQAQTLIHYWNFNTDTGTHYTPVIPGIDANYSILDTTKAQIVYAEMSGVSSSYSSYIDYYATAAADSDVLNAQFGDAGGNALRVRNPSDSMYLLFYIPTTGYKNITLKYAGECSSITHGALHQVFSYSVDSGLTWRTSGLSIPSDSAWLYFNLTTVTFSDTDVNNNAKLVFRMAFTDNANQTSGNNRFDNVTVSGDSVTSSTTTGGGTSAVAQVAVAAGYTLYPNPVTNTLVIGAASATAKTVAICNELGQNVYTGTIQGANSSVDVTTLSAGTYFISINETATGTVSTMKFVKQ